MKVEILKDAGTPYGFLQEGNIIELPDDVAESWCRTKLAKHIREKPETATAEPRENAMIPTVERRKRGRPRKNENNTI
jgi:hypothetical protein